MDKQTMMESILKTVKQEVEEWVKEEDTIKEPFLYEHRLLERVLRIGKVMMSEGGGKLGRDRNAKKNSDGI